MNARARSLTLLAVLAAGLLALFAGHADVFAADPAPDPAAHASDGYGDEYGLTQEEALEEAMSHSPLRPVINAISGVGFVLIVIGLVLCIVRVLIGPNLADRVVASDLITLHITALVILLTIRIGRTEYFDLVLIVTLISFAATIAFAQLIAARAADAEAAKQRQAEHDLAHADDPDRVASDPATETTSP